MEAPDTKSSSTDHKDVVDDSDPPELDEAGLSETSDAGLVHVSAVPGTIAVAQSVDVIVFAQGVAPLRGLAFHLEFDSSILRYDGSTEGAFMPADGHPTVFMAALTTANDRVVVGLARLGAANGMAGSGELCRFRFTGIKSGDARLAISQASATSPDGHQMSVVFRAAGVRVR